MISRRQSEMLHAIRDLMEEQHCTPTYEEIASRVGLSSLSTVHKHIHSLRASGFITLEPTRKQSLAITDKGREILDGRKSNAAAIHAAIQRIGTALGMKAGTSLTEGAPEARIKEFWLLLDGLALRRRVDAEIPLVVCRICSASGFAGDDWINLKHYDCCILKGMPHG